jgi:predicted nucleotidyltransferase
LTGKAIKLSSVQEIIGRILAVVKPQKVFLFGSAARDEMRENSDIDLLEVQFSCRDNILLSSSRARELLIYPNGIFSS